MPRVKRGTKRRAKRKKTAGTRQRIFPHKIKTLPRSQRSRGPRTEVRLLRPQTA